MRCPWSINIVHVGRLRLRLRLRQLLFLYIANGFELELLDGGCQLLHVVVVDVRELIEPCDVLLGRHWHQLPADLTLYGYRIMVVIVADLSLCVVQRFSSHILGHVYAGREGVLCLNCILSVPTEPCSRVPE